MVATGVADRAAERIARMIYLDAFVPESGQSLFDLLQVSARARAEAARTQGDGWLLPPNPTPADTSPEDIAWITPRRRWQPVATFTSLSPSRALPRICRAAISTARALRLACSVSSRAFRSEPAWTFFEIDASHSPNVTAPEGLARLLDQMAR